MRELAKMLSGQRHRDTTNRSAFPWWQRLFKSNEGATAVEFALLVLPFFVLIFAIIEISLLFFVDSTLDGALAKTARKVRVGYAASQHWDINAFKNDLCTNLSLSFGCSANVKVVASVVTNMASVTYTTSTANGVLTITETYNTGMSGEYVLIQVFLPWKPILPMYKFAGSTLSDGTYILAAASLFKNEPF